MLQLNMRHFEILEFNNPLRDHPSPWYPVRIAGREILTQDECNQWLREDETLDDLEVGEWVMFGTFKYTRID